ncbi:MAG: MBL fold metallo-hydrolase [Peptostreptococcaceae bacterium]|nr:MBL fold metallo-hydrolase [Peptostreptococcaceae bacterium]
MKIAFYGAARMVTGSCHYLESNGKKMLVDCGLQQGMDANNLQDFPFAVNELDYVFLTHAHIDHSGRLPLLAKNGFNGKVFCTSATEDLCNIMLRDSAHIQEFEAEWRNRKGKRLGKDLKEPLYTMADAETLLSRLEPCPYNQVLDIDEGIQIRFRDIGHLLGSSCIEVWLTEGGLTKKIVFSGDIGNNDMPLIKDPSFVKEADYVVIESTYGDRTHHRPPDQAVELAKVIQKTFDRGGNVVIPSFAVGRTQELLYYIRKIKEQGMVKGHGIFDVYVDSPLASEATRLFDENKWENYDEEAMELVNSGINPIAFDGLHLSVSADESREINFIPTPKVIISASGMAEAGRIKHHLKHNLWRPESTILFVGFQAHGTTGRAILDGAESIRLFGEEITVRAEIVKLEGISGHADREGLVNWLANFEKMPQHIFVVHGEEEVSIEFGKLLKERFDVEVTVPLYTQMHSLYDGSMIREGIAIERTQRMQTEENSPYGKLLQAIRALDRVVLHNKGGANRDLNKFTQEIEALVQKWDR